MISNRPKLTTGQRPNTDLEQNGLITCDMLIEYDRHKRAHAIWLNLYDVQDKNYILR